MTNEEFRETWRDCDLINKNGLQVHLKDIFMVCWGEMEGGLLFDEGGPQGSLSVILKVDKENNCYVKVSDPRDATNKKWELIGKIVRNNSEK